MSADTIEQEKPETLKRHQEMYERRLEQIKHNRGLSEHQILNIVNKGNVSRKKQK